jgi:hypothetical protein
MAGQEVFFVFKLSYEEKLLLDSVRYSRRDPSGIPFLGAFKNAFTEILVSRPAFRADLIGI